MPPVRPGPREPNRHPKRRVRWRSAYRIISTRYPPINLFERLTSDAAVWEVVIVLEQRTNARVRDAVGDISMVATEDRLSGPGASFVMSAFTHINTRGSRFGDGTYGVYYAAAAFATALAETVHHFQRYAADAADGPRTEDMRVLVGAVDGQLMDVGRLPIPQRVQVLDPDDYRASQAFGRALHDEDELGVVYPSVRDQGGHCIGVFRPRVLSAPRSAQVLAYHWNGVRVDRWFSYQTDEWTGIDP